MSVTYKIPFSEFVIRDTHRGLWLEDGKLKKVLEAGRYRVPGRGWWFRKGTIVECVLVDIRSRELTIKGQEILTSDKVSIRVNILAQFAVVDPAKAMTVVENYEERLYSDIQLAARRSLASMSLDEILTNRTRLSDEILADVKESAATFGVSIARADVKDLIFPGNLQDIMNRVLAAQRNSQAQLVDAQTRAEVETIQAKSNAESVRLAAQAQAEVERAKTDAEAARFEQQLKQAKAYSENPALLRMAEIEAMQELGQNANAQLHISMADSSSPKPRKAWSPFGRP
jgi:regulator of protease activity HflC (stomatin/prohibitin superfamily)